MGEGRGFNAHTHTQKQSDATTQAMSCSCWIPQIPPSWFCSGRWGLSVGMLTVIGGGLNASLGAVIDGMLCELNMPWWDAPPPQFPPQLYPPASFKLLCSTPPQCTSPPPTPLRPTPSACMTDSLPTFFARRSRIPLMSLQL